MTTRQRKGEKDIVKEPTKLDIFHKALKPESKWTDKDEFLDVIYWFRQIIGFVIGVAWGIFPFKGIIAIIVFFAINAGVVHIYFSSFQKADEEEYGGMVEILKEGLMTSFASFLVSWIICYSALHGV
ncbi:GEL complex subunit OPTI-like [Lineus longissimus]|uniref:GEL complex subunit OPTI-like n=1 Tax=Lineus longissimus TaxID=88925 RepID=UPI002B4DE5B8